MLVAGHNIFLDCINYLIRATFDKKISRKNLSLVTMPPKLMTQYIFFGIFAVVLLLYAGHNRFFDCIYYSSRVTSDIKISRKNLNLGGNDAPKVGALNLHYQNYYKF